MKKKKHIKTLSMGRMRHFLTVKSPQALTIEQEWTGQ
jgi:hypothetical protein